jgi:hypothetical protein
VIADADHAQSSHVVDATRLTPSLRHHNSSRLLQRLSQRRLQVAMWIQRKIDRTRRHDSGNATVMFQGLLKRSVVTKGKNLATTWFNQQMNIRAWKSMLVIRTNKVSVVNFTYLR